jgi:hypothetical protein
MTAKVRRLFWLRRAEYVSPTIVQVRQRSSDPARVVTGAAMSQAQCQNRVRPFFLQGGWCTPIFQSAKYYQLSVVLIGILSS